MVLPERLQRHCPDRHDALLPPFAAKPDQAVAPVQVLHIHADQLAHAGARGIERFEDRAVAPGRQVVPFRKFHERVGVVLGQDPRQVLRLFGGADLGGGILPRQPFTRPEAEETSKRGQLPRQGGFLFLLPVQPRQIPTNRQRVDLLGGQRGCRGGAERAGVGKELAEVRTIATNRLAGRPSLHLKKRHESANRVFHASRSSSARWPIRRRFWSLSLIRVGRGGNRPKLVLIGWK